MDSLSDNDKYKIIDEVLRAEEENIKNNNIKSDRDMVDVLVNIIKENIHVN